MKEFYGSGRQQILSDLSCKSPVHRVLRCAGLSSTPNSGRQNRRTVQGPLTQGSPHVWSSRIPLRPETRNTPPVFPESAFHSLSRHTPAQGRYRYPHKSGTGSPSLPQSQWPACCVSRRPARNHGFPATPSFYASAPWLLPRLSSPSRAYILLSQVWTRHSGT